MSTIFIGSSSALVDGGEQMLVNPDGRDRCGRVASYHRRALGASPLQLRPGPADEALRWTDGDTLLPPMLFDGIDRGSQLELWTCGAMRYALSS